MPPASGLRWRLVFESSHGPSALCRGRSGVKLSGGGGGKRTWEIRLLVPYRRSHPPVPAGASLPGYASGIVKQNPVLSGHARVGPSGESWEAPPVGKAVQARRFPSTVEASPGHIARDRWAPRQRHGACPDGGQEESAAPR